jgi:hypothetical protein
MFSFLRSSPTALSAVEAEQWLFRHDEYLADHRNKEPNLDHYFDEASAQFQNFREKNPQKTPESIRKAVILIFQEALAKSWLDYQDAEWSPDLKSPKINITEVFPGTSAMGRDEQKLKVRQLLGLMQKRRERAAVEARQKEEQVTLQSRTVAVLSPASESVRPDSKPVDRLQQIKQWYEGTSGIDIVALCPNLKKVDASSHREVVRQYLVQQGVLHDLPPPQAVVKSSTDATREQTESIYPPPLASPLAQQVGHPVLLEPSAPPMDQVVYPTLSPFQQKDPYVPSQPFASLVDITEPAPKVARRGIFSFGRGEPAVKIPKLDTKLLEAALKQSIAQKEDIAVASYHYIQRVRALIPPDCSLKQRVAILEQTIANALKIKCSVAGYENHLRVHAFTAVIWDASSALGTALMNPDLDAAPIINGFLEIKDDLAKLHKAPYPQGISPEKLFVKFALFGNTQPEQLYQYLMPFMTPLGRLCQAYHQAKATGADAPILNTYRNKWSQWAWALETLEVMRLPKDFFKSKEPIDLNSLYSSDRVEPVTQKNALRLRRELRRKEREERIAALETPRQLKGGKVTQTKKRAVEERPVESNTKRQQKVRFVEPEDEVVEISEERQVKSPYTKSYIEALFEGMEPNGAYLKKVPYGIRYRLYKLAVLEQTPNPWSNALWDHEEGLNPRFSPTSQIYRMERDVISSYLRAYSDQTLIRAIYRVVRGVEGNWSPSELQELISKVPSYFFRNDIFQTCLRTQAEVEGVEIDYTNPVHSPIIAQAMMAWFDHRLSAFVKLKRIS